MAESLAQQEQLLTRGLGAAAPVDLQAVDIDAAGGRRARLGIAVPSR